MIFCLIYVYFCKKSVCVGVYVCVCVCVCVRRGGGGKAPQLLPLRGPRFITLVDKTKLSYNILCFLYLYFRILLLC